MRRGCQQIPFPTQSDVNHDSVQNSKTSGRTFRRPRGPFDELNYVPYLQFFLYVDVPIKSFISYSWLNLLQYITIFTDETAREAELDPYTVVMFLQRCITNPVVVVACGQSTRDYLDVRLCVVHLHALRGVGWSREEP